MKVTTGTISPYLQIRIIWNMLSCAFHNLYLCTFEESSGFKNKWQFLNDLMVSNCIGIHSPYNLYEDIRTEWSQISFSSNLLLTIRYLSPSYRFNSWLQISHPVFFKLRQQIMIYMWIWLYSIYMLFKKSVEFSQVLLNHVMVKDYFISRNQLVHFYIIQISFFLIIRIETYIYIAFIYTTLYNMYMFV